MSLDFSFLTNPFFLLLVSIPIMLIVGIFVGTWLSQPRKNRIISLAPETGRGIEYDVEKEDRVNIYCNPVINSPPQRFLKREAAFNMIRKGWLKLSNYALWIGRQGTAYTQKLDGSGQIVKDIPLRDAVKTILGDDLYSRIPNNEKTGYAKDKLEKSELLVTVEFPKSVLTPKDSEGKELPSVSSDDVRGSAIDRFIGSIVNGVDKLNKRGSAGDWVKIIFCVGTGIAIGIILSLIFKWGAPIEVQPSQPQESAAQAILEFFH